MDRGRCPCLPFLVFFYLVLDIFVFFRFRFLFFVRIHEFAAEDVDRSDREEYREEDPPGDVELDCDEGAEEDQEGNAHVIGSAQKELP